MKTSAADILTEIYNRRASANPSYSRRAFSRDLKLSPSFVTNYFKGRRRLSVERAEEIAQRLAMDARTAKRFVKAVLLENLEATQSGANVHDLLNDSASLERHDVAIDQFQFFNGWYHVAVLDLIGCADFQASAEWIAGRLGIAPELAFATVERLKRLGLVKVQKGRLVKTEAHLRVPTDENGVSAVVNFHRQMIGKALEELEVTEEPRKSQRYITGVTMSIPREKLSLARERIDRFKREMAELLTNGDADSVVQLNIQLFPLTKDEND